MELPHNVREITAQLFIPFLIFVTVVGYLVVAGVYKEQLAISDPYTSQLSETPSHMNLHIAFVESLLKKNYLRSARREISYLLLVSPEYKKIEEKLLVDEAALSLLQSEYDTWKQIQNTHPFYRDAYYNYSLYSYRLNRFTESQEGISKLRDIDPLSRMHVELEKKTH